MKLCLLITIATVIDAVVIGAPIICSPDDPSDCYPQIFIPTKDWQIIKPGQDIPAGLHVRLNVDTLQREAKLMDPGDLEPVNAIILSDEQDDDRDVAPDAMAVEEQYEQATMNKNAAESPKSEIENNDSETDMAEEEQRELLKNNNDSNDFNGAINIVQDRDSQSGSVLEGAIDTLIELSHDIDYGIKLASNKETVEKLLLVAKLTPEYEEKVYRLIGSCLRNNPEAIDLFMASAGSNAIINDWIKQLTDSTEVITKRILGIFESLVTNNDFKYQYLNNEHHLLDDLVSIYPRVKDSRTRIVNIFEDLKLIDNNSDSEDSKMSHFLQTKLISFKFNSEDQFKLYYNKLVELHGSNKSLKGSKEFVAWLDQEALLRSQGKKPRDTLYTNSDSQFDKGMLETRHTVFGNPNALRKHFDDEL